MTVDPKPPVPDPYAGSDQDITELPTVSHPWFLYSVGTNNILADSSG